MNIQISTQFRCYGDGVARFTHVERIIFTGQDIIVVGRLLHFDNGRHIAVTERKGFEMDNGYRVSGLGSHLYIDKDPFS